jgi:hypothetical protein
MKTKRSRVSRYNPYHDHPLLKKGGVHQKSNKAKRNADKQALKKLGDDVIALLKRDDVVIQSLAR